MILLEIDEGITLVKTERGFSSLVLELKILKCLSFLSAPILLLRVIFVQ